jgi:hypothetical protein
MEAKNTKDTYIIPHNFTDNGKILGFIEKQSAASALIWFVPAAFINFKFLPFCLDIRILTFILLVCPVTLIFLTGIGGETLVDFARYLFGFLKRKRVYIYERKNDRCFF